VARERKTPAQRAQEDVDTAQRVLDAARKRKEKVDQENPILVEKYGRLLDEKRQEILDTDAAVNAAEKRVAFLSAHPDLMSPEPVDDVL